MPLTTVDTGIITDASVTSAKMSVGAALGNLGASAITSNELGAACVTPAKLAQPFTFGTVAATTSGTEKDFSIPAWARTIRMALNGVSLSGTSQPRFRLGTSGGIVTTGYNGTGSVISSAVASVNSTAGFDIYLNASAAATDLYYGALELNCVDATNNIWAASGVFSCSAVRTHVTAGSIALAAALTTVRLTTINGTDTLDAGSVNVLYE